MYNPNYLERPYVVVLNKIDLPEVGCLVIELLSSLREFVLSARVMYITWLICHVFLTNFKTYLVTILGKG